MRALVSVFRNWSWLVKPFWWSVCICQQLSMFFSKQSSNFIICRLWSCVTSLLLGHQSKLSRYVPVISCLHENHLTQAVSTGRWILMSNYWAIPNCLLSPIMGRCTILRNKLRSGTGCWSFVKGNDRILFVVPKGVAPTNTFHRLTSTFTHPYPPRSQKKVLPLTRVCNSNDTPVTPLQYFHTSWLTLSCNMLANILTSDHWHCSIMKDS